MRRFPAGPSAALATLSSMYPGLSAAARARARAGKAGGDGTVAAPGTRAQPLARDPATLPLRTAGAEPGPVRVTLIQQRALNAFVTTGNRASRDRPAIRAPGARNAGRRTASMLLALLAALGGAAVVQGAIAQNAIAQNAVAQNAAAQNAAAPSAAAQDAAAPQATVPGGAAREAAARDAADGAAPPGTAPTVLSPAQRAEVLALLRDALRTDPSILRDAIAALAAADAADAARARRDALAAEAGALFRDPADPSFGNPRGDVTLVEFFDARCGYCKSMVPAMTELLRRDGGVRLVLKDLPILGPNSVLASRALLAAQRQGKYAPLFEALMRLRGEPTEPALQAEATRIGLDWPRLRRDMDDPAVQARLAENLRLARALGIEGTPALVGGATLLPGAADLPALERLVAEARRAG